MAYRVKSLTLDATLRGKFDPSRAAENKFYTALRKVAQAAGHIIDTHTAHGNEPQHTAELERALAAYSKKLEPWARRHAKKMLESVKNANERAYKVKSKEIGRLLQTNVVEKEVGQTARALLDENVVLITSIPIEAGQRVQKLAAEAFTHGTRANPDPATIAEIKKQLGLSTEAATTRAKLIAITETARANASFNQARATAVGSSRYRWRNSGDGAVRPAHKKWHGKNLDGQIFSWDSPPTLDDGTKGHPGTFPRCRCYAEPIFDEI